MYVIWAKKKKKKKKKTPSYMCEDTCRFYVDCNPRPCLYTSVVYTYIYMHAYPLYIDVRRNQGGEGGGGGYIFMQAHLWSKGGVYI